jgi:ribonuclease-3
MDFDEKPFNKLNKLINENDVNKILENFGIKIKCTNINYYRKSLVHKSYITRKNEDFKKGNEDCPDDCLPLQEFSNERYEFLGDSILSTSVAHYLFKRYIEEQEGFLTKMRSKLVNGKMLSELCKHIGLNKWIIISKQIEENNGRNNEKILEDVFEAFICAIYLDFNQLNFNLNNSKIKNKNNDKIENEINETLEDINGIGFLIAEKWIINIIEDYVDFAELISNNINYKDKLIKYFQQECMNKPQFIENNIISNETNSLKTKEFIIVIKYDNNIVSTGKGYNRKAAEQNAAYNALKIYNQI